MQATRPSPPRPDFYYLFSTFAQLALASSKTSSTVDDKQLFLATIIIFSRKPARRNTPSQRCPQLKNLFWPVSIFFKFQKKRIENKFFLFSLCCRYY